MINFAEKLRALRNQQATEAVAPQIDVVGGIIPVNVSAQAFRAMMSPHRAQVDKKQSQPVSVQADEITFLRKEADVISRGTGIEAGLVLIAISNMPRKAILGLAAASLANGKEARKIISENLGPQPDGKQKHDSHKLEEAEHDAVMPFVLSSALGTTARVGWNALVAIPRFFANALAHTGRNFRSMLRKVQGMEDGVAAAMPQNPVAMPMPKAHLARLENDR